MRNPWRNFAMLCLFEDGFSVVMNVAVFLIVGAVLVYSVNNKWWAEVAIATLIIALQTAKFLRYLHAKHIAEDEQTCEFCDDHHGDNVDCVGDKEED